MTVSFLRASEILKNNLHLNNFGTMVHCSLLLYPSQPFKCKWKYSLCFFIIFILAITAQVKCITDFSKNINLEIVMPQITKHCICFILKCQITHLKYDCKMNKNTAGHGLSCWFVRPSQECVMLWNILEIVFGLKNQLPFSFRNLYRNCMSRTLGCQLSLYTENIQMESYKQTNEHIHDNNALNHFYLLKITQNIKWPSALQETNSGTFMRLLSITGQPKMVPGSDEKEMQWRLPKWKFNTAM